MLLKKLAEKRAAEKRIPQSTMIPVFHDDDDGKLKDFIIQLWGRDDYSDVAVLLHELPMMFLNQTEALTFAKQLRKHYDHPTDTCWVRLFRVEG